MPKQVDHAQRRTEIIDAAWRTLEEQGLEGTTMREIAARAGCTTGRLNHYFDSRDAIVLAALRRAHVGAAQRMVAAMGGRRGVDALREVLLESLPLDPARRTEWAVWLAFWSKAAVDDDLRAENATRYGEWRSLIADLVASVPDRGPTEHERVADALVAAIDGLGLQLTLDPDAMTVTRAEAVLDELLGRLLPGATGGAVTPRR